MTTSFFSLIPSKTNCINRNLKLKIDIFASTGSHRKYLQYVTFPWLRVVAAQALQSSGSYWLYKAILTRTIQLRPADPSILFHLCRRLFRIKIASAMKTNNVQGQRLKRVGIYLPSPVPPVPPIARCMWHFRETLHLRTPLLQLLTGIDNVEKMTDR
jgi:hypothetical protein